MEIKNSLKNKFLFNIDSEDLFMVCILSKNSMRIYELTVLQLNISELRIYVFLNSPIHEHFTVPAMMKNSCKSHVVLHFIFGNFLVNSRTGIITKYILIVIKSVCPIPNIGSGQKFYNNSFIIVLKCGPLGSKVPLIFTRNIEEVILIKKLWLNYVITY